MSKIYVVEYATPDCFVVDEVFSDYDNALAYAQEEYEGGEFRITAYIPEVIPKGERIDYSDPSRPIEPLKSKEYVTYTAPETEWAAKSQNPYAYAPTE